MRNSAPGRCRYIRERSQPTASLLFFPGFLSGIRPGRNERSKRRKTGKTRHPVRSGIQSGYIGPTRRAASYGRPPANRPPHATSRPAPKKRDTRGTNGDTVRSFRKRSGPFPSVGRSCGQRSAAAKRCKRPIPCLPIRCKQDVPSTGNESRWRIIAGILTENSYARRP